MSQLALIGRDRVIIEKFAKYLFNRAGHETTKLNETARGNDFLVKLADGYVTRVSITLDRILPEEER